MSWSERRRRSIAAFTAFGVAIGTLSFGVLPVLASGGTTQAAGGAEAPATWSVSDTPVTGLVTSGAMLSGTSGVLEYAYGLDYSGATTTGAGQVITGQAIDGVAGRDGVLRILQGDTLTGSAAAWDAPPATGATAESAEPSPVAPVVVQGRAGESSDASLGGALQVTARAQSESGATQARWQLADAHADAVNYEGGPATLEAGTATSLATDTDTPARVRVFVVNPQLTATLEVCTASAACDTDAAMGEEGWTASAATPAGATDITWRITATNTGNIDLADVRTVTATSDLGSLAEGIGLDLGDLAPGEAATATFTTPTGDAATTATITVSGGFTATDPTGSDLADRFTDAAGTTGRVPSLASTATASAPGEPADETSGDAGSDEPDATHLTETPESESTEAPDPSEEATPAPTEETPAPTAEPTPTPTPTTTPSPSPAGPGRGGLLRDLSPTPAAPIELLHEDFQNVPSLTSLYALTGYVGAHGETYTANPYWLSTGYCNGFVAAPIGAPVTTTITPPANPGATLSGSCGWWSGISQPLNYVLGTLAVSGTPDAKNNVALANSSSSGGIPANSYTLITAAPVTGALNNHFYTGAISVAANGCGSSGPNLTFGLSSSPSSTGTPIDPGTTGINPCTAAQYGSVVIHGASVPYALRQINTGPASTIDSGGLRDFLDPRPTSRPVSRGISPSGAVRDRDVSRIAAWVATRGEGERNRGLFWAACRLAENGVAPSDALDVLTAAAGHAGLSEREVTTTVRSAYRAVHPPPRTSSTSRSDGFARPRHAASRPAGRGLS